MGWLEGLCRKTQFKLLMIFKAPQLGAIQVLCNAMGVGVYGSVQISVTKVYSATLYWNGQLVWTPRHVERRVT